MALTELDNRPQVTGQYADGRIAYDLELPVPGAPLQEIFLGVMTPEEIETWATARKAAWDANQSASSPRPVLWLHVGYYFDLELGALYYFQYGYADYPAPPDPEGEEV